MAGQTDQMWSTQEYSRATTDNSQHPIANITARSSTVPYGVPCSGWGMKFMSIILCDHRDFVKRKQLILISQAAPTAEIYGLQEEFWGLKKTATILKIS